MSKTKKLTIKEAKLVKAKVQGKTMAQAAKEAGYMPNASDETRRREAYNITQKPHVKAQLQKELAKQGITLEAIVKPIADGLKAEKVSIVGNGDQAMAEITPDHNVRIKSSQIASKWMGVDTVTDSPNTTFVQVIKEQTNKYT